MTALPALLAALRREQVRVWLEGGALRYSAPRGALTARFKAELVAHRDELLAFLQAAAEAPASPAPGPRARAAGDGEALPLSFAQERLWFMSRLHPRSPLYNVAGGYRLRGPLRLDLLERALDAIVARHEALRTSFAAVDGRAVQRVEAQRRCPIETTDLRGLAAAEREPEARRIAEREALRVFEHLDQPLLRVRALVLADDDHVLLATLHHIIADGWSVGVLTRELSVLYRAYLQAEGSAPGEQGGSPLEPLALQYADFAHWQRAQFARSGAAQLAYWREQLREEPQPPGAPGALRLSADFGDLRGGMRAFELEPAVGDAVRELARAQRTTVFAVLLAALKVVLRQRTGRERITVATAIANRNRREIEPLIGFFVNTLLLRTDLAGDPTFRELVERVRGVALDAYSHQDVPFEKLVQELRLDGRRSDEPLFDVMFAVQNAPMPDPDLPGIRAQRWEAGTGTAKFELLVTLEEVGPGFKGLVEYRLSAFSAAQIDALLAAYAAVIRAGTQAPERRLSAIAASVFGAAAPASAAAPAAPSGRASGGRALGAVLAELRERGVRLWLDGERLRYSAPSGALTGELREALRERRSELLTRLQAAALDAAGPGGGA